MSDVLEGAATRVGAPVVYPLGVSRPPLEVADLPTPEEVFGVARFGRREAFRYAVGPSLIGLGAAIGSGEWILGPLTTREAPISGAPGCRPATPLRDRRPAGQRGVLRLLLPQLRGREGHRLAAHHLLKCCRYAPRG